MEKYTIKIVRKKKNKVGQYEIISENHHHHNDMTNIIQPTELGESLKELNKDDIESGHKMSTIDLRANLHPTEVVFILQHDALVHLHVIPPECLGFTRQKKRLSVSQDGLGRKQVVETVVGKRDQEQGVLRKIGATLMGNKGEGQ